MAFEGIHRLHTREEVINPEDLHDTYETFLAFRESLEAQGFEMYNNINEAYRQLNDDTYIVRREDPLKVLSLLNTTGEYTVEYVGGEPYSNCVEWNPRLHGTAGIENAYFEGFTDFNHVVTVVGFEHDTPGVLQRLPDASKNFHGLDRHLVRSFSGVVSMDTVRFINLRVPAHLLPESELTEDELDILHERNEAAESGKKTQPLMVHRSFIKQPELEEMKRAA